MHIHLISLCAFQLGDIPAVFEAETLANIIVHASDLSSPIVPWALSKVWSELVGQEFLNQARIEESLGLEVSALHCTSSHFIF